MTIDQAATVCGTRTLLLRKNKYVAIVTNESNTIPVIATAAGGHIKQIRGIRTMKFKAAVARTIRNHSLS
jgi:hypothetical protein